MASSNSYFIAISYIETISLGYYHCVESVQIRSYFWSVFFCIQSKYRKTWTRNNSVFGHFSRSVCVQNNLVFHSITFNCNHMPNQLVFAIRTRTFSLINPFLKNCWPMQSVIVLRFFEWTLLKSFHS